MFVCLFCGCFLFGFKVTEFCNQLLLLWDGWAWSSWGLLWADQVGKGLLTKLQPAVAASAGRQLNGFSASTPFPSTSFLLAEFHQPFLSFSKVTLCFAVQGCLSLCPCCVLSMPVLLGAHHLLPASLGQQLWTGRRTEAPPAWNTILQLLFSYWTLLWLMMMFLWQSIPWFREGEKRGIWRPLRRELALLWLRLTENLVSPFPLPYALYIS